MNLHTCLLTKNECYQAGVKIRPCGVMVHSTGANNPTLRRYVQPDDGLLGVNKYKNDWNQFRPGGRQVCVHAFIGKLADGSIATYQTLPWDIRGWHSGYATKQSKTNANKMGYIGFEICEDGLTDSVYFGKVYREAVELTAYLCKLYNLDPRKDGVVICHKEGNQRGIASNHKDVTHWFPIHGKSMDTFRADVAAELSKAQDKKEDVPMKPDTVRYNTIAQLPAYAQATLIKMTDKGIIGGGGKAKDENGRPADLDLSMDMVRVFVTNDRAGLYD